MHYDLETINKALRTKLNLCQEHTWQLQAELAYLHIEKLDKPAEEIPHRIPLAMLLCLNCGQTTLYNLNILEIKTITDLHVERGDGILKKLESEDNE